jgi:hypothetical protein
MQQKIAQPAGVQPRRAEVREGAVYLRQEPPLVFTNKFSHEVQ